MHTHILNYISTIKDAVVITRLSERVTDISKGLKDDADIGHVYFNPQNNDLACHMSDNKTRCRRQPQTRQAKNLCRFKYPHLN